MNEAQPLTYQDIAGIVGLLLVFLSAMATVIFHFKGWHQQMEKILWGRESISMGFNYNCLMMGQWVAYCILPFAARRAQLDKEIVKVPLKLKICIHCSFWFGVVGFTLLFLTSPSSA